MSCSSREHFARDSASKFNKTLTNARYSVGLNTNCRSITVPCFKLKRRKEMFNRLVENFSRRRAWQEITVEIQNFQKEIKERERERERARDGVFTAQVEALTASSSSIRVTLSRGLTFCHSFHHGQVRSCRYFLKFLCTTTRAKRCSCSFL